MSRTLNQFHNPKVPAFSKADTVEQIRVRLDDKLSRIAWSQVAGEDVTLDLIGYLVLLRVAERLRTGRRHEGVRKHCSSLG